MQRVVIKLGGSVLIDEGMRLALLAQIVELSRHGLEIVLVHGGGKQIGSMLGRLQIASKFHDGLRVTDKETRDVVQMVLAGKIGKDLVAELSRVGLQAVSLAGGDGASFFAEPMLADDGADLGYVGRIVEANSALIDALMAIRITPVIACLALGAKDWEYYNINGDQMAAAVAIACGASDLIFVTDVGGVNDERGLQIEVLDRVRILGLLESGVANDGMRPKLRACLEALDAGVSRIRIVGASVERVLESALLQRLAVGTLITDVEETFNNGVDRPEGPLTSGATPGPRLAND